jgi:hypothetical protein
MKAVPYKTTYSNLYKKSKSDNKSTISRKTPPKPIKINNRPVSLHTIAFKQAYSGELVKKPNL